MRMLESDVHEPRAKVLIVEDEAVIALELSHALQSAGYAVCDVVDSADTAVVAVARHAPDVVLMDVVIRGAEDGIATARRLACKHDVPVIYLTSFSDPRTVERAAVTSPYGYLTKPYQIKEVRAAIEVALFKSQAERRLRDSERWFACTLRCVADGVLSVGLDDRVRFVNPAAERLLGRPAEALLAQPLADVLLFADGRAPVSARLAVPQRTLGRRLCQPDGSQLAVDESVGPILGQDGQAQGMVVALHDVTRRLEAEQALLQSEERFRTAFEFAPVGMALVSIEGRLIQANAAFQRMMRVPSSGLEAVSLADLVVASEQQAEAACLRDLLLEPQRGFAQHERRFRAADGHAFWGSVNASVLEREGTPFCFLYQVLDISERKADEGRLAQLANFDALTGLPNRARMQAELQRQCRSAQRLGVGFAVLLLDLDDFKPVNDRLGHAAGDEVLRQVAQRLRQALRASDLVCRWGGDEFVVLASEITTGDQARSVGLKLRSAFESPMLLAGGTVRVGLSAGVALFPLDGRDAEGLLACADAALYRSKRAGKGRISLADSGLQSLLEDAERENTALREQVESGDVQLRIMPLYASDHRQPQACWVELGFGSAPAAQAAPYAPAGTFATAMDAGLTAAQLLACLRTLDARLRQAGPAFQALPIWFPLGRRLLRDTQLWTLLSDPESGIENLQKRLCFVVPAPHGRADEEADGIARGWLQSTGVRFIASELRLDGLDLRGLMNLGPAGLLAAWPANDEGSDISVLVALAATLEVPLAIVGAEGERLDAFRQLSAQVLLPGQPLVSPEALLGAAVDAHRLPVPIA
jgi:diguanylate cyclase (GGDEF)-like protein/PAS domain S-box-containing protein